MKNSHEIRSKLSLEGMSINVMIVIGFVVCIFCYLFYFFESNYDTIIAVLKIIIMISTISTFLYLYYPLTARFVINDKNMIFVSGKFRKKYTRIPFALIKSIDLDHKKTVMGFVLSVIDVTLSTGLTFKFKFMELSKKTEKELDLIRAKKEESNSIETVIDKDEVNIEYRFSPCLVIVIVFYAITVFFCIHFF